MPLPRRLLALVLACAATLAFAGCGDSEDEAPPAATATAEASAAPTKPEVEIPAGSSKPKELVKRDLKVGTGATATAGKTVEVQYVGVSLANGRQFDASWDRGEPFSFQLGAQQVIQGWDQGVEGMKVGGRRQLFIPARLAYGKQGSPPAIGPNEPLTFVIDLLGVQ